MNAATKQIERILTIGLMTLSPDARRERMEKVIQGRIINGSALTALIEECKVGIALFMEIYDQDGAKPKIENAKEIKSMLEEIDGKTAVAGADPEELVEVILELRKWVTEKVIE